MAGRIHTQRWPNRLIKPPYGSVEIDWAHPLAQGLASYCPLNEAVPSVVRDRVVPRAFTVVDTAPTVTPLGFYFAGNGRLTTTDNPVPVTEYPYSLVGSARVTADSNGTFFNLGDSGGSSYSGIGYYATDNSPFAYFRWGGTARVIYGTANSWTDQAGFHLIAFVARGEIDHELYIDGVSVGTNVSSPGTTFASVRIVIGDRRVVSNSPFVGYVGWCAAYNGRALTVADQLALKADPYCFLRPIVRRSYGFVGAAPSRTPIFLRRRRP